MTPDDRDNLTRLLRQFGDAMFDCGHFRGDALSDRYDELCKKADRWLDRASANAESVRG